MPFPPSPSRGADRRTALRQSARALAALSAVAPWWSGALAQPQATPMTPQIDTRPIPSTGEALPVIGCGTYIGFDVAPGSPGYGQLPGVLDALFAAGGSVLDSSPMYGRAEATTGELLAAAGSRDKAFIATKVWTSGREAGLAQVEQSFARLATSRIDLMQVHNLVDWRIQLASVRRLKDAGRVRYVGITHYTASAYSEVEAVLRAEKLDFLQINYALDDRATAGAGARRGGAGQPAVWRRWPAAAPLWQAAARLDGGHRLRQLGAGAAEVRAEPPGRDLRHSRHRPARAHAGQPGGGPGRAAGCGFLEAARGFGGGVMALAPGQHPFQNTLQRSRFSTQTIFSA